jgi:hypothetical protein
LIFTQESSLRYSLLSVYAPDLRPVRNTSTVTTVNITLDDIQIINLVCFWLILKCNKNLKDIENLIKILISVLLIGEIQFSHKKGNNYDAVQVKNMEIIENGKILVFLLRSRLLSLNNYLSNFIQSMRITWVGKDRAKRRLGIGRAGHARRGDKKRAKHGTSMRRSWRVG